MRIVLVTGMSGSGKSVAIRLLEDAGYYCIDNLPARFLGEVCDLRDPSCRIADLAGTCVPRPQACIEIYDPVCGSDQVTYGNDCLRLVAGATWAHAGTCQ